MIWSPQIEAFIQAHINDDPLNLILSAGKYKNIDVRFAAEQIAARRQIKVKLPTWYSNPGIIMSGRVPAEQCSSEQTAIYKRRLVVGDSLVDMTGGMGVDVYYMSRGLSQAHYIERQPFLCEVARHNFKLLVADNITVHEGDALSSLPCADTIYLDPARRANDGSRVYNLEDCEPNVISLREELLKRCHRLLIKISPMADLKRVLSQMPGVNEVHIIAVKGECKEVILLLDAHVSNGNKENNKVKLCSDYQDSCQSVKICCVDFKSQETLNFHFTISEETNAQNIYAESIGKYLFEPDVTLMKGGAFKCVGERFGLKKLSVNSHLYTTEEFNKDLPGRVFEVEETIDFNTKNIKNIKKDISQANITVRNFPMTAEHLKEKLEIKDGGNIYLFATTISKSKTCIIKCKKVFYILFLLLFSLAWRDVFAKEDKSLNSLFKGIVETPLVNWQTGDEFVYMNNKINLLMVPEQKSEGLDSLNYRGSIWYYDSIIAEENWLGQKQFSLRFISSDNKAFRFDIGPSFESLSDTTYCPVLPGFYNMDIIRSVDKALRGQQLYILVNDKSSIALLTSDSIREITREKFIPVHIDSVSYGIEMAPLQVYYSRQGLQASVCCALSGSREAISAVTIDRIFSIYDPKIKHPEITDKVWKNICLSEVLVDMTSAEVRLSMGKPVEVDRINTSNGVLEYWLYQSGLVVELLDGRVRRTGSHR